MNTQPEEPLQVRRAKRQDLAAISTLVQEVTPREAGATEPEVMDWLFGKGLWVADDGLCLRGVAAWQAENLVAVTDIYYVSAPQPFPSAGGLLLEKIEAEAALLMCEVNVLVLPRWTPAGVRAFLHDQGYEAKTLEALHRIWREVLQDFLTGDEDLMVKRLRDRMVMIPL
ncbi:MAG: hypothetical protein M8467_14205 [Anaerolineae bacterium]|nr:hypothetical protein [Anaerolineae bacterium]